MKYLIVLFLTALSFASVAQDIIIKKNGEEIKAKVEEITIDMVKYREAENITGPVYNLPLAEVFMIQYANGTSKYYGQKDAQADTIAHLKKTINYSKADSLTKESKSQKTWGVFGLVVGPLFVTTGAISLATADASVSPGLNKGFGATFITLGSVEIILGAILISQSKKSAEKAKKIREGYAQWGSPNLQVYSANSSTGLMIHTRFKF